MYMSHCVKDAYPQLIQFLGSVNTGGSTALGPGLVAAYSLACCGKPGSKIIIWTDGLANKGLGSVESVNEKQME